MSKFQNHIFWDQPEWAMFLSQYGSLSQAMVNNCALSKHLTWHQVGQLSCSPTDQTPSVILLMNKQTTYDEYILRVFALFIDVNAGFNLRVWDGIQKPPTKLYVVLVTFNPRSACQKADDPSIYELDYLVWNRPYQHEAMIPTLTWPNSSRHYV